jgi:hypothetical protein
MQNTNNHVRFGSERTLTRIQPMSLVLSTDRKQRQRCQLDGHRLIFRRPRQQPHAVALNFSNPLGRSQGDRIQGGHTKPLHALWIAVAHG